MGDEKNVPNRVGLSENDLAAIRERHQMLEETGFWRAAHRDISLALYNDIPQLVAEVERLRAYYDALNSKANDMYEIVEAVADSHMHQWDAVDPQEVWACDICHVYSQDYAEEVQAKARALLGMSHA